MKKNHSLLIQKKFFSILFAGCLIFSITGNLFAQRLEPGGQVKMPTPGELQARILEKSRHQKKTAFIMLGTGAGLSTIGLITAARSYSGGTETGFKAGGVMFATGLLTTIASVPVFILSGQNKKKAMKMELTMEEIPGNYPGKMALQPIPSFGINVSL